MILRTLSQLKTLLQAELGAEDAEFMHITLDSRQVQPGALFVAIKGAKFDGHDFLAMAKEKGAACALVTNSVSVPLPYVKVKDTVQALGKIAAFERNHYKLPVLAVTGSAGKTTTQTMLAAILASLGSVLSPEASFNNAIGVPLTLLRLTPQHQYAVLEMGANHEGEIAYLTNIAKPCVAVITNIGPVHLEGFGDLEGVARAKSEIFQGLDADGVAVINADDAYASFLKRQASGKRVVTFGLSEGAMVRGEEIHLDKESKAIFTLNLEGKRKKVTLPTLGEHHVMNALAAAAAAHAIKVPRKNIIYGLTHFTPVSKRLIKRQGLKGASIIDDSYNANLIAAQAALKVLANQVGEKIFIFGDMAELGAQAEEYHFRIGEFAKEVGVNRLFGVGELSRHTVQAFGEGAQHFAEKPALIEAILPLLHPQMTVLVKGSRGARMEEVVASLMVGNE